MNRLSVTVFLLASALSGVASPSAAQSPGSTVLHTRLGGDSAQATDVRLRANATYRLDVQPSTAQIVVRRIAQPGENIGPLQQRPLPSPDSAAGGVSFSFATQRGGDHMIELVNPGAGPASVRIVVVTPGDRENQRARAAEAEPPVLVLSEVLSGRGEYVSAVLAAQTAYRVELDPNATLSVRPLRVGSARPPALTRSFFDNSATPASGASYTVVPAETGEYRIEVASPEPVRVRVVRDPREQALLEGRMQSALSKLVLGYRAVRMGELSLDQHLDALNGWEICLGLEPGRIPFASRLGGCALTFSHFETGNGEVVTIYGIGPRYELVTFRFGGVGLASDIGVVGKLATPGLVRRTFISVGFGMDFWVRPPGIPLALEVSPGLVWVRQDAYSITLTDYPSVKDMTERLSIGLHLRL